MAKGGKESKKEEKKRWTKKKYTNHEEYDPIQTLHLQRIRSSFSRYQVFALIILTTQKQTKPVSRPFQNKNQTTGPSLNL